MYEFYNKEGLSPLQRYNKAIRHVNMSPDYPLNFAKADNHYEVFKFGRNVSQLKRSAEIIVRNPRHEESVKNHKFPHGYRARK
jgi:hypothetical protein